MHIPWAVIYLVTEEIYVSALLQLISEKKHVSNKGRNCWNWIGNHISQVITNNFIPHFIMDVITYPYCDWIWSMFVKRPLVCKNGFRRRSLKFAIVLHNLLQSVTRTVTTHQRRINASQIHNLKHDQLRTNRTPQTMHALGWLIVSCGSVSGCLQGIQLGFVWWLIDVSIKQWAFVCLKSHTNT